MPTVFLTTERLSTFSQFALFKELVDSTKNGQRKQKKWVWKYSIISKWTACRGKESDQTEAWSQYKTSAGISWLDRIQEEAEIYTGHEKVETWSIYGIDAGTDTIHMQRYR